jgi:magnesium transporter
LLVGLNTSAGRLCLKSYVTIRTGFSMLKRYEIEDGGIISTEKEDSRILVFICPDKDEISFLTEKFMLDEHTVNSALDPDELSRLEFEKNHFAVIFKRPRNFSSESQFLFKVSSMGVFVFKDCMIILISEDVPLFDGRQISHVQSLLDVMLKIFNRSITHFLQHLRVINMISDELEQKVNTSMENKYLFHMFTLEKSLVYYLNAVNSNSMVVEKLRNNASRIGFTVDNIEYLDDIHIENNQCLKQTEIYSNIISSLTGTRASIVNNNLNNLMKTLNIITIGIMVPTFVVSAFSMNVTIPLQKNPYAFILVMGMSMVALIASLAFFRYKRW